MPAWLAALEVLVLLLGLYATVRLRRAGDAAWRSRPPIRVVITADVSGFVDAMQKSIVAWSRLTEQLGGELSAAISPALGRLAWRLFLIGQRDAARRDLRALLDDAWARYGGRPEQQ